MKKLLFLLFVIISCNPQPLPKVNVDELTLSKEDSLMYWKKDMSLFTGIALSEKLYLVDSSFYDFYFFDSDFWGSPAHNAHNKSVSNIKKIINSPIIELKYPYSRFHKKFKTFPAKSIISELMEYIHIQNHQLSRFSIEFPKSYSDNAIDSLAKFFHKYNAKIRHYYKVYYIESSYKNGLLSGFQRGFQTDTTTYASTSAYKELYNSYYDVDTLLLWEYNLNNRKENGQSKEWYTNGNKKIEYNFKNEKRNGLSTDWYENGQIHSRKNYKDGKFVNGQCWDESGTKIECKENKKENYDEESKIKLKDGVLIDKGKFVKSCQNSFFEQTPEANNFLNIKGLCDCMTGVIGKYFTSSEIIKFANVYDISQVLSDKSNLWKNGMVMFEKMVERGYNNECIIENTINKSGNYNIDDQEGEREVLLNYLEKTFLPKILKEANMSESEFSSLINKDGFLNCILTKMYGDYSAYEIMNSSEKQRDEIMNKISEKCLDDNIIKPTN